MTDASVRFDLPLIQPGQAQKEITHNRALARLDALVQLRVVSDDLMVPPATPVPGACWIVPTGASAAWAMPDHAVAAWTGQNFETIMPQPGTIAWIVARQIFAWFDGTTWRVDGWPCSGVLTPTGVMLAGGRPTLARPLGGGQVDVEARAALNALLDVLEQHGLLNV